MAKNRVATSLAGKPGHVVTISAVVFRARLPSALSWYAVARSMKLGALTGSPRCAAVENPPRKTREPGVGRFHLPAEPAEAARSGFSHAFQLGGLLSATDRRKSDADAFFSHGSDSLILAQGRLTF